MRIAVYTISISVMVSLKRYAPTIVVKNTPRPAHIAYAIDISMRLMAKVMSTAEAMEPTITAIDGMNPSENFMEVVTSHPIAASSKSQ